jgi:hypothetical protein
VVVSSPSFIKCRPLFRHHSTHDPPHKQLLIRLGQVVHCRLSSIVPGHLSFPRRLSFVVPSIVCHLCHHTALVHPQSTQQAVACQCGGGCSVDHCCCPCCCPCRHHSSFVIVIPVCHCHSCRRHLLFVIIVPVIVICHLSLSFVICHCPCSLSSSLLSSFIICCHHSSSVIVPVCRRHHHPCCHHSLSTCRLFFVICPPCPHSTHSPPHEQLLVRLGVGGSVVIRAGGGRFKVGGEGGSLVVGGPWLGWFVLSPAVVSSLDPRNETKKLLD